MQLLEEPKQVKRTISYGRHEERVLNMEDYLMDHYGYDRSQLHKVLVRERYHQLRFVWEELYMPAKNFPIPSVENEMLIEVAKRSKKKPLEVILDLIRQEYKCSVKRIY